MSADSARGGSHLTVLIKSEQQKWVSHGPGGPKEKITWVVRTSGPTNCGSSGLSGLPKRELLYGV